MCPAADGRLFRSDLDRQGVGHTIWPPSSARPGRRRGGCCERREREGWLGRDFRPADDRPAAGGGGAHGPRPLGPGSAQAALAHPEDHGDLLSPSARSALRTGAARSRAQAELDKARTLGVRVVGRDEPDFPDRLRRIYDPPPVLYVRGTVVHGEGDRAVAVVGSRAASPQGLVLARALARDLAAAGAHHRVGAGPRDRHRGPPGRPRRRRPHGGRARLRPRPALPAGERRARRRHRCAGCAGVRVPARHPPRPKHFPRRNRVIAGWGAGRGGGRGGRAERRAPHRPRRRSKRAARCMAVPGPSRASPASNGTNQLIRDGAVLVRGARDVAAELGVELEPSTRGRRATTTSCAPCARDVPRSVEELQARCGRALPELLCRVWPSWSSARKVRRLPGAAVRRRSGERQSWRRTSSSSSRRRRRRRSTSTSGKDFAVKASMGHVRDLPKKKLGRRRREGLRGRVRGPRRPQEGPRRAEGGGQGRRRHLPGGRPRPRGRGHLLAPRAKSPGRRKAKKKVQRVVFNEITKKRDRGGLRATRARSTPRRSTPSRRAASSTAWSATRSARSSGTRCGAASPPAACSRSRSSSSATASARSGPSCPRSTGRCWRSSRAQQPPVFAANLAQEGRQERRGRRTASEAATVRARPRGRGLHASTKVQAKERRRNPVPPFITSQAPAGGLQEAALPGQEDDAGGAAPLRGRRARRRRQRRPHHLHAHRLHARLRRRPDRGARAASARPTATSTCPRSRTSTAARRTRRTRTRPSARPTSTAIPSRSSASCRRTSYALYKLIWNRFVASQMRPAVYDETCRRTSRRGPLPPPRQGLDPEVRGLPRRLRGDAGREARGEAEGGRDRAPGGRTGARRRRRPAPSPRGGRRPGPQEARHRPALHAAAAALQRGEPGQGARGERHRPPLHLRLDHRAPSRPASTWRSARPSSIPPSSASW